MARVSCCTSYALKFRRPRPPADGSAGGETSGRKWRNMYMFRARRGSQSRLCPCTIVFQYTNHHARAVAVYSVPRRLPRPLRAWCVYTRSGQSHIIASFFAACSVFPVWSHTSCRYANIGLAARSTACGGWKADTAGFENDPWPPAELLAAAAAAMRCGESVGDVCGR